MDHTRSQRSFAAAEAVLVGGVNSPVRAFHAVGGTPLFIARGDGAYLWDVDGHRYIDYVCSWGAMMLGHAHPAVVTAVHEAAQRGASFGAPTEAETALAQRIGAALPSIERLRFVSSGTEAVMSAIRLARGCTGRSTIIKFSGCYHGHADAVLVKAGSGALTLGEPDSAGVPAACAEQTLVSPYNDIAAVERLFAQRGQAIAAVIVEPIAGNMGMVEPRPDFLPTLRRLCTQAGAVLIFDEVMTGFRVAWGGAQRIFNITPDLTCLGKVIGGGLPLAAVGGRRELMEQLAPLGPVYQAGTLSGNPLAVAAGCAVLEILAQPGRYETLQARAMQLAAGWRDICAAADIPCHVCARGGMWGFHFAAPPVDSLADAQRGDATRFSIFFHAMLARGVYLAPSPFEAAFVSLAHTEGDIADTLQAVSAVIAN